VATRIWQPSAAPAGQVTDYVFGGTWEASDIVNVTIGAKTISVTAGSTTISTVVDNVVTAITAADKTNYPEFADITAERSSNTLRLTAGTAGVPFVCTVATTETGGGGADAQTIDGAASSTGTTTTSPGGPNNWDNTANWSSADTPDSADDVIIDNTTVSILYGLAQSGVALTSMTIGANFSGLIGLPATNENGYFEYRETYLAIGSTTTNVGAGIGPGSGRLKLDTGSGGTVLNVHNTGGAVDSGLEALLWKGTGTNTINVHGGSVGIAVLEGEAATVATLRVTSSGASVRAGSGLSLTTLDQDNGTVILGAGATTVNKSDGTLTINGSGAFTTINNYGGTAFINSSGTITTLKIGARGVVDFSGATAPITVTNCSIEPGGQFLDPGARVTVTNGIVASLSLVTINPGPHKTITITAGP
jgi:hypothetical protein